jgi:hypothetical protein
MAQHLEFQMLSAFQAEREEMGQRSGDSKNWPHLKRWAIETRPFRIGARIKQVGDVAVTSRVPEGNPGTPQLCCGSLWQPRAQRISPLRLMVIFIERDRTIWETADSCPLAPFLCEAGEREIILKR